MQELVTFASEEWLIFSGFVASGLAVIFYELKLKSESLGSVSTPMAVRMINSGFAVVDVRPADKFASGHIVDARNIPEAELTEADKALAKNKKGTLLVCDTGSRSGACATRLRKQGMDNVYSIKGGIAAWQQENLPVVSDADGQDS